MTMSAPTAAVDLLDGPATPRAGLQRVTPSLLALIRAEFLEMPGLQLTLRQAARLWNLDLLVCDVALRVLADEHFLDRTKRGAFRRAGA
jgi:hypothetical protein